MLKAPENPNCKNDFENVEIEYLTLFCPQLQMKLLCSASERNNKNLIFLATNQLGKIIFQTASFIKIGSVRTKEKKKKGLFVMRTVLQV